MLEKPFNVRDGATKRGPAAMDMDTHPVRLVRARIVIGLPN
jgi:hypothetical protein